MSTLVRCPNHEWVESSFDEAGEQPVILLTFDVADVPVLEEEPRGPISAKLTSERLVEVDYGDGLNVLFDTPVVPVVYDAISSLGKIWVCCLRQHQLESEAIVSAGEVSLNYLI